MCQFRIFDQGRTAPRDMLVRQKEKTREGEDRELCPECHRGN